MPARPQFTGGCSSCDRSRRRKGRPRRRRFFFAPLVYGVKCESSTLALQTPAAIKESRAAPGTVAVRDAAGRTLAAVAFRWEPYWLVTSLTVALPAMYAGRASDVVVANEWGDETRVEVTCSV